MKLNPLLTRNQSFSGNDYFVAALMKRKVMQMEINKKSLEMLMALDDEALRGKLLEIAEVAGIGKDDAQKLTGDMRRVRALLMMVSDDDIRNFLTNLKK